jgi:hypothetical protein
MNSKITEAQQIEINRRVDVMYSLIPIAKHIIFMRSDIKDQIKEINQKSRKVTIGGFFIFGTFWHWIASDGGGFSWDWGVVFSLMAGAYWCGDLFKISQLEKEDKSYASKLMDLSAVWCSVTTQDTFLEILKFETELGTIPEDEENFSKWITEAREAIYGRVGVELS